MKADHPIHENPSDKLKRAIHGRTSSIVPSCGCRPIFAWLAVGLLATGCAAPPRQATTSQSTYSPRPYRVRHVDPIRRSAPPRIERPELHEETVVLGTSVERRPITMTIFGRTGETTLIMGGIHGNEPTSADLAGQLIVHLRSHPELYQSRRIAVIPAVNPDGLLRGTRRNTHNVDLNRNFPASNFPSNPGRDFAGGPYPVSECETLAVMAAMRRLQPAKVISIHSIERGRHGNNFDGPAHLLAAEMSRYNGYNVLSTMGYATPGSFGSWAGVDQKTPTITLELPRDLHKNDCWEENRDALLAAIRFSVENHDAVLVGNSRPKHAGIGK